MSSSNDAAGKAALINLDTTAYPQGSALCKDSVPLFK